MITLLKKYKEPILYLVFGVLTTLVNILAYYLTADVLFVHYLIANGIAWAVSVLFAFVTNKMYVFESKSWSMAVMLPEMGSFFLARVATGIVDMVLMWLLVDILLWNQVGFGLGADGYTFGSVMDMRQVFCSGEMLAKVLVNVIIIILNYVASKLWIFRKA